MGKDHFNMYVITLSAVGFKFLYRLSFEMMIFSMST